MESSQIVLGAPAPAAPFRAAWRSRRLEVGGLGDGGPVGIAVFEAGRSDPGAPTLVLVHGMGHWTQAAWNLVAADFAATHRIVAFDLPGFGASEKPRVRYTLPFLVSVLRAVVADANAAPFALAGHSLGGLIAADYAARYPGDVRGLTLIAPAGFLRTPQLVLRILGSRPVTGLMGAFKPSPSFVRRTLEGAVFSPASIPPEDMARALELGCNRTAARAFASVYAGAMHEMLHMRQLHARLAAWRGPALLIWGRQDRFIPVRALAGARAVYPDAEVLEIERCGHCPSIEYPERVVAAMRALGS
jgi:pimeloyl-ACP methyl ester carboxylesterase